MTLAELFHDIIETRLEASLAAHRVSGVFDDSRRVEPGGVFVALQGSADDGRRFIAQAIERGAASIVGETLDPQSVPTLTVPDARLALARLAARWHGLDRGATPRLIGVTGTNGKSTTVFMTAAIARAAGQRCGMLGTVQYDLCARTVTADMTTPGPLSLCGYLSECRDAGASLAVMEVSSHALDQRRTAGLRFVAAGFTNLTGDHLDYHGTMEAYADAKARLFANLDADACALINRDAPWHDRMTRDCKARVLTYAIDQPADVTARITRDSIRGTLYRMKIGGHDLVLENAIVGKHNVYNALAAAGLALGCGLPIDAIERGLSSVRNIPGRLQRVPCSGVDVFVDYAHTDDALRNVLGVLKPLTKRRLITVFGCGGDRDRTKRPRMARVAAEYADAIIVTSDNPRTEDPRDIIREIVAGFDDGGRRRATIEPDRRAAIHVALACAQPGDCVLIAGKGHENYQILGREKSHFDDVEVAIQAAAQTASSGAATA
ncbi:MAG: UDP-N-acetylmuramoyl-L-alanyl-D-glutamate--2,6-diaminopimelate ligase [Phycisphaerae bacterium]